MFKITDDLTAHVERELEKLRRSGIYFAAKDHPLITEVALRRPLRAQMKLWKRPFIRVGAVVWINRYHRDNKDTPMFASSFIVPKLKKLEPLMGPVLAAVTIWDRRDGPQPNAPIGLMHKDSLKETASVWQFSITSLEFFDRYLRLLLTDPEIRATLRCEGEPLLPKVTAQQMMLDRAEGRITLADT